MVMGTKRPRIETRKLSAPPGFASLTSFSLKRVEEKEENTQQNLENPNPRTWILHNHITTHQNLSHLQEEDTRRNLDDATGSYILREAPIFYPSEEEFKDAIAYITSLSSQAEKYGICRIIPPQSWKILCSLTDRSTWENSTFMSHVQYIGALQSSCSRSKSSEPLGTKDNRKQIILRSDIDERVEKEGSKCSSDHKKPFTQSDPSTCGQQYTLDSFKKFADNFKDQYFRKIEGNKSSNVPQLQSTISEKTVEDEYRRIHDNPTIRMEVLHGDSIDTRVFGNGFPTACKPLDKSDCLESPWNLNNLPRLPGSLVSSDNHSLPAFIPRLHVGMCFTTKFWKSEEQCLYSLTYMHIGAPTIWYCIPRQYIDMFEAASRKDSTNVPAYESNMHSKVFWQLLSSTTKSEGIPIYRCVQNTGEFVLIYPGACYSGLDSGFNCMESVEFAPLDWLAQGWNLIEQCREKRRRVSISYDKLLLGAASDAVKARWELSLLNKATPYNSRWKNACEKNGVLLKALKSRVKWEGLKREYLCNFSQSRKMDANFDAEGKRECIVCFSDLHLSAVGCQCSTDSFSCLEHAKQLCSCGWHKKFFLFRYEMSELNVLVEALEGKVGAVYKWARENLGLALKSSEVDIPSPVPLAKSKGAQDIMDMEQFLSAAPFSPSAVSRIRAEMRARMVQSPSSNGPRLNKNTSSTIVNNGVAGNVPVLCGKTTDAPSRSTSLSLCSDSEGEASAEKVSNIPVHKSNVKVNSSGKQTPELGAKGNVIVLSDDE